MNLDKRSHDFLLYQGLKNHFKMDLTISDLEWMVEYLEERLEYYCSPEGKKEL